MVPIQLQRLISYFSPFPPSLAGSALTAAGEGHPLAIFVKLGGAFYLYRGLERIVCGTDSLLSIAAKN